jgi:ComF family protein
MLNIPDNYWLLFSQCILCHGRCNPHTGLCDGCLLDLPWITQHCPQCHLPQLHDHLCSRCLKQPPPFHTVHALFEYQFPVDQLIAQVKYHDKPSLIAPLALQLAQRVAQLQPRPQLLVPVPAHAHRLRQRGYNQAQLIAEVAGRALGIPVARNLVRKTVDTTQQMALHRDQRIRNLRGVFEATPTDVQHMAIIDDVMTTGTTIRELCRVLKQPQRRLDVWVLVRTANDR